MDIEKLLQEMILEEKVGQLFLLAFSKDRLDEARVLIRDRMVGAAYISNDNIPSSHAAVELTRSLQGYARETRLKVPLLLGVDQEGAWCVMADDSVPGPGNMALGATGSSEAAAAMYRVIAKELSAVGLNVLFAPCSDCNTTPHNSIIGMRSFGQAPELVGKMVVAAVKATQSQGVVATVKHFPGHGDTTLDTHRGLPTVTRNGEELRRIDLAPFNLGIKSGVDVVMTAHSLFPALDLENPATLSSKILIELLRGEMGFDGVILSDSMNMGAMKKSYAPAEAAVRALQAGVDLIMLAEEHYDHDAQNYLKQQCALLDAVCDAVKTGKLCQQRVDEATLRVLKLKEKYGLFDAPLAEYDKAKSVIACDEHQGVATEVSQQAISVMVNLNGLIPLSVRNRCMVLVNTTERRSYEILWKTRGIGPNPNIAAFDRFAEAFCAKRPDTVVIPAEKILSEGLSALEVQSVIVAVTENYPLPGIDFEQASQAKIVKMLAEKFPDRLVVVGLRDPYELMNFPEIRAYLCAFSFRPHSAIAAADALFGEFALQGKTPVEIPAFGMDK